MCKKKIKIVILHVLYVGSIPTYDFMSQTVDSLRSIINKTYLLWTDMEKCSVSWN